MISNVRVLYWFVAQFTVAVGGATAALLGSHAAIWATLSAAGLGAVTLSAGWSTRHGQRTNKGVSEGIACLGLAAFLYSLFTQGLLLALALLLFFTQLALNTVLREYRQLYLSLLLGFVFIMVGAAEAVSGYYLLVFVLYTLSALYCLTETWLDQRPLVVKELQSPGLLQRLQVSGSVLLLALLIYLLMPRPPAAMLGARQAESSEFYQSESWEQQAEQSASNTDNTSADADNPSTEQVPPGSTDDPQRPGSPSGEPTYRYEGFEEQFDIDEVGDRSGQTGNGIVAYMQAPHGSYLKMRVFDHFDGQRWSHSRRVLDKKKLERGTLKLRTDLQPNFIQIIDIAQNLPAWIPSAPQVVELTLPASVIALDAWQQPLLPGPLRADTRYTVASHIAFVDERLQGSGPPPRDEDLQVPRGQDPRIAALAQRVTAGANNPLHKASLLEHHLRTAYDYSYRSIFDSQGVTPLSRFLFDERAGHCEYFASAMAIMLRSLNIPARLVTGFSATQKNPLTGYYEIRALDGHAWVEAWIDGRWLTFEPTALYDLPQPREEKLGAQQINDYVESLQRAEEAIGNQDLSVKQMLISLWQSLYVATLVALSYLKFMIVWALPYLVGLAVVFAIACLTRHFWQPPLAIAWSRWRIRLYRPRATKSSLRFYLFHLQRIAAYQGRPRSAQHTVAQWSKNLNDDTTMAALIAVNHAVFYEDKDVPLSDIQKAALRAVEAFRR